MNATHPDSDQITGTLDPRTRPPACLSAHGSGIRPPLTVDLAHLEQAGRLIRCAMMAFESDRRAAWRYLIMASTIFTHDLNIGRSTFPVPEPPSGLAHWQTKRVVDHIECNLQSKIDIAKLANLIAVSKGHFSRAFKQRVGLPPMAFIAARRVERAKTMLISTREPIADIAIACGFGDQSHLTRRFCHVVGVTPGRYRRINSHLQCVDQLRQAEVQVAK